MNLRLPLFCLLLLSLTGPLHAQRGGKPGTTTTKSYRVAEIFTTESVLYGRFEFRMQAAAGSGIISNFFTWKEGSELTNVDWEEIDIEVFGKEGASSWQSNIITVGNPRTPGHRQDRRDRLPGIRGRCAEGLDGRYLRHRERPPGGHQLPIRRDRRGCGRLTVTGTHLPIARVSLYTTDGRHVLDRQPASPSERIHVRLSEVPPGVYFLRVTDADGVETSRSVTVRR